MTAERDWRTAVDAVAFRIAELDRELVAVTAAARDARTRQAAATAERQAARHGRDAAREAYDRASLGLAHLQDGLDELVRRAHGHRQLERRLAEARALLARPELAVDTAAAALAELDDRRARCEAERAELDRELRDLGGAARRARPGPRGAGRDRIRTPARCRPTRSTIGPARRSPGSPSATACSAAATSWSASSRPPSAWSPASARRARSPRSSGSTRGSAPRRRPGWSRASSTRSSR